MTILHATLNVNSVTFPVLKVKDRSKRPVREVRWCYQKQLELVLFGANNGGINALLNRISMGSTTFQVKSSCVGEKLLTQEEFEEVLDVARSLVDAEARSRVRVATLCPLPVCVAACTAYGRCPKTQEVLAALQSVPKAWELAQEQEEDEAEGVVDLALQEKIEEELDETMPISLQSELALDYVAYKVIPADDTKIAALSPVPQALEKQFDSYSLYRLNEFNRHRSGGAVQETTISGDRGTGLRFFGYAKQVHKEVPDLRLLAGPRIGELAEKWMQYLRAPPRKLKGSSLANYMQSLIQLSAFANSLLEEGAPDPPTIEMLNLRKQGEMLAKQDKLFAKQSDTWMDWSTVQECRVKSLERHYSLNTLASLKDAIIINFHSLQAPDRGEVPSIPILHTHKHHALLIERRPCWLFCAFASRSSSQAQVRPLPLPGQT